MRALDHPRERVHVVRDPGVRFGPFRVMRQTTGHFVVVDERKDMGDRIVFRTEGRTDDDLGLAKSEALHFWRSEGEPAFDAA